VKDLKWWWEKVLEGIRVAIMSFGQDIYERAKAIQYRIISLQKGRTKNINRGILIKQNLRTIKSPQQKLIFLANWKLPM
jgi:hypothetical protein